MDRRTFFRSIALGSALALTQCAYGASGDQPLNVLFITADDLGYESLGVTGCRAPDITPNIDRLASEGMRFERAHVIATACMPSREAMMTGRYPHRSGAMGFVPIRGDVTTLPEMLREAGYYSAIMFKEQHHAPSEKFPWDKTQRTDSRQPEDYYRVVADLLTEADDSGKPFFIVANVIDPHRPWPTTLDWLEERWGAERINHPQYVGMLRGHLQPVRRRYSIDEIDVPGFLPDIPVVREEMTQYYASVHRCDESVGAILRALDDADRRDDTLVMFLSDHGMSMPFSKTNVYQCSTRTPWMVRWPGKVAPGQVDSQHFISTADFMPTILDALDLPPVPGLDGRSLLPLLFGESQSGRDHVFTFFNEAFTKLKLNMRCVTNARYSYIYNAWYGTGIQFMSEPQNGAGWFAMLNAAQDDPAIRERVDMLLHRVPEELYDLEADPDQLRNLVDNPAHKDVLDAMRRQLLGMMESTDDPLQERVAALIQQTVK